MLKALIILLVNTITICFYKDKLPNYYKVIIIIILKKVNKKDYSFLETINQLPLKIY